MLSCIDYRIDPFALSSTYFRSLDWGAVKQNPVLVYGNQYSSIQECPVCSSPLSVKCHISTSEFEDGICDYTLEQLQMPYCFVFFLICDKTFSSQRSKVLKTMCSATLKCPILLDLKGFSGTGVYWQSGAKEYHRVTPHTYGEKQNGGCLWVESETATDGSLEYAQWTSGKIQHKVLFAHWPWVMGLGISKSWVQGQGGFYNSLLLYKIYAVYIFHSVEHVCCIP